MAEKAMVFIDGGWLYKCRTALFSKLGEENFEIDYAKLPRLLCEDVANALDEDVSLVSTLYFGTIPSARSGFNTSKQYAFYDFLERNCRYQTNIQEINVGGEESRSQSTWVDVSMATNIVYYGTLSSVMDIAIVVSDNVDLFPAIRRIRYLGKRVQVVTAHGISEESLASSGVGDFDPIYLDNHAAEVKLVRERVTRVCKQCGREEETTWAGPEFFCSKCRGRHRTP